MNESAEGRITISEVEKRENKKVDLNEYMSAFVQLVSSYLFPVSLRTVILCLVSNKLES